MSTITSIEPQKKNTHRFNVFIDGEFAFGADEDLVVNQRLIVGKIILPEDLNKFLYEAEVGKLMEKMYGLFSIRARSEREVRDYFRVKSQESRVKKGQEISQMVIDAVVEKLRQKGILNDLEFAKAWVESRRRSKGKGINVLKLELYKKGITKDVIEEVLSEESRIKNQESSEEDLAQKALEKKLKSWKNLDKQTFRKKAYEYLMRQGFEYSTIKSLVEKNLEKRYTISSEIGDSPEENKNEDDF